MFATPAWAQEASRSGLGDYSILFPLVAVFVIFYFLIIRPQNKRVRAHREMIGNLRRGDVVVTAGGMIGKIYRLSGEQECIVELAEGIRVRVLKATISDLHSKAPGGDEPAAPAR